VESKRRRGSSIGFGSLTRCEWTREREKDTDERENEERRTEEEKKRAEGARHRR